MDAMSTVSNLWGLLCSMRAGSLAAIVFFAGRQQ